MRAASLDSHFTGFDAWAEPRTPRFVSLMPQSPRLALLQEPVDFDFATGAKIDAAVRHERNYEARGVSGAVACRILLGSVKRIAHLRSVEGIQDGRLLRTVPSFRGDRPEDTVFRAVRGDGGRRARIIEMRGGHRRRFEQLAFHEVVAADAIVLACNIDVAIPIRDRGVAPALHRELLQDRVFILAVAAHLVAVDHVNIAA